MQLTLRCRNIAITISESMADKQQTIRCFVAIELPQQARVALAATQDKLRTRIGRAASDAVRWVRPEGVHITIEFLGDVPAARIDKLVQALRASCVGAKPFTLSMGGVGVFPNLRRPRVIWVGLEGQLDALRTITDSVRQALLPLGFKPDKQFNPHMTLGRVRETVRPTDLEAIADEVGRAQGPVARVSFEVGGISLMESRLQSGGSVYTQLAHVEFA